MSITLPKISHFIEFKVNVESVMIFKLCSKEDVLDLTCTQNILRLYEYEHVKSYLESEYHKIGIYLVENYLEKCIFSYFSTYTNRPRNDYELL